MDNNFERARKQWNEWPAWKREYQLLRSPDTNAKAKSAPAAMNESHEVHDAYIGQSDHGRS